MTARCPAQHVRFWRLCMATLLTGLIIGCAKDTGEGAAQPPESAGEAETVTDTVEHGPVTMTVSAKPATVRVGSRLQLIIDVVAERGVVVSMPELGEDLGAFTVRSRSTPPDVPEDGSRHWTHTYTLDTFATGDVEIPTIELSFTDAREQTVADRGAPLDTAIATDPLTVHVQSVLRGDESEADYRDIRGAVEVPVAGEGINWVRVLFIAALGLLVLGALAAAVLALVLIRRSKAQQTPPPRPPHVQAAQALDELAAAGLIEQGAFHAFYTRLSGIVRLYIEQRFGLMAPERTTDEFLREAERDARLSVAHRELLTTFLRAADMVKFARFEPAPDEAHAALDAARGFVVETTPSEPAPIAEGAAS